MLHKAIRYRLYPTKEQEVWFAKTFGCCRKIWNLMLSDKIESYQQTKSFGKQTPAQYKTFTLWSQHVQVNSVSVVSLSFNSFVETFFKGLYVIFINPLERLIERDILPKELLSISAT